MAASNGTLQHEFTVDADPTESLFTGLSVLSSSAYSLSDLWKHVSRWVSVQEREVMRERRYSELRRLETFDERFEYLRLVGQVGAVTFGYDRWVNQQFYTSQQWKRVRERVILRDMGCDLGVPGYEVHFGLLVHHMNPMTVEDIERGRSSILNPEFLICTSKQTHNAIHYGGELPRRSVVERKPGDTKLW